MRALIVVAADGEYLVNESYSNAVDAWEMALKHNRPVCFTRPNGQMPFAVLPNLIRAINGAV